MTAPARRNNPARTLKMINAMQAGPQTYKQLVAVSSLGKVAVATWVKSMRKERVMHIGGWAEDVRGRKFTPVFQWGAGDDVARAGQARTAVERMRDYRLRLKGATKIVAVEPDDTGAGGGIGLEDLV
jgi:hypothetical protein